MKLEELQDKIGYHFKNVSLLELALTHSSYGNEHFEGMNHHNERLEFLGDSVLELGSSEYLYLHFPDEQEGKLTRLRASLVCEPTLAFCAREFGLGDYLRLGRGEESTGGRYRDSIVSDALEAVIGAIYLDSGYQDAKKFIDEHIMNDIEKKKLFYDSKTVLQEMVQKNGINEISYHLTGESGPDHNKLFETEVWLADQKIGSGSGHTKKASEQQAAYQAILALREKQ